ncbi:MAG: DUF2802 domain-containing protein [Steroidobacteraceae bacterium]
MPAFSIEIALIAARAIALTIALLVFALAFRNWRRSAARDAQRLFEQMDLIRGELLLLSDRMDNLETAAPKTIDRPAPQEPRAPAIANAPAPRGYEVAARLARGGATCEELISSCGLSRHEAELMLRLHQAEAARNRGQVKTDNEQSKAGEERRARLSVVG